MYELKQAGDRTFYIDCPVKMGIYCINDKEAGKKVLKLLKKNEWKLTDIINTHFDYMMMGVREMAAERADKPLTYYLEETFEALRKFNIDYFISECTFGNAPDTPGTVSTGL